MHRTEDRHRDEALRFICAILIDIIGGAVKRNPVTIIVPCHRVVGSGRAFGGYGGRLDIKAELLELEGVDLARFDLPNL